METQSLTTVRSIPEGVLRFFAATAIRIPIFKQVTGWYGRTVFTATFLRHIAKKSVKQRLYGPHQILEWHYAPNFNKPV